MKKRKSYRSVNKTDRRLAGKKQKKEYFEDRVRNRSHFIRLLIGLIIIAMLLATAVFIYFSYSINTVTVEGNIHYTNEEIEKMVFEKPIDHNSLYLSLKYRSKTIRDVPFIEAMDVKIVSPHSVKITVYEKAIAGYVEYKGQYFYFDKDGIIVESSNVKTLGIPQIMGLQYDHIVLFQKLPVEDEGVFKQILDMTQLLNKFSLNADKIYFDQDYNMTLYFDEAQIRLGDTEYIDEKIMKLKVILPELEGKKGILRMESYTPDSANVTFEMEK